jgi:putative chitinase
MTSIKPTTAYGPTLIRECEAQGLLRNQAAYVLATGQWETAHTMEPVKEAYWLSEEWRKANLRYYPWYGRGFVQLTWEENYDKAQDELNLGTMLTDNPDRALDPVIAAQVIVRGMTEGWFTGKKLSDYITLQKSDFINARRIVNGTDKANDIAALAQDYDAWLLAQGYGVEAPVQPDPVPPPVEPPPQPDDDLVAKIAELENRVAALEAWRKS